MSFDCHSLKSTRQPLPVLTASQGRSYSYSRETLIHHRAEINMGLRADVNPVDSQTHNDSSIPRHTHASLSAVCRFNYLTSSHFTRLTFNGETLEIIKTPMVIKLTKTAEKKRTVLHCLKYAPCGQSSLILHSLSESRV